MARLRWGGVLWLLFCSAIFIFEGAHLEHTAPGRMVDFKAVFYGARALIQHRDPYRASEILHVYQADGGEIPADLAMAAPFLRSLSTCVNLPATLLLVSPIALLPWGVAHVLWMFLTASALILAAFLVWDLASDYASAVSVFLIGVLIANAELVYAGGNTAGLAVGLCIIAVWCFFRGRFAAAGIVCLGVSLAMKPQDAGLIWLFFLLLGGAYRRWALRAIGVAIVLGLLAAFWVTIVSPHWAHELHANLALTSARGGLNDAGPVNFAPRADMIIDLQTVFSVFRDEAGFYNAASYLVSGLLLVVWFMGRRKAVFSKSREWFGLAMLVCLSMLPVYHRVYDAKLLLLTVPACAIAWTRGGLLRWIAVTLNFLAILLTGDLSLTVIFLLVSKLHISLGTMSGKIETVLLMRPVPLILLTLAAFYLWLYLRGKPASEDYAVISKP